MNRRPYHVIFLGAGASATSGYPVGQELRLRTASIKHFQEELDEVFPNPVKPALWTECINRFKDFDKSIELFRHGGFATVDEFSKLASAGFREHVQNMKKIMRIILSIKNPEDNFHESDYYSFIQRLFRNDKLNELRPDISIITFNYDCYLDFLLLEAFRYRQKLSDKPEELNDLLTSKLTSGFFNPNADNGWAQQTQAFNYFKMHGSLAYGSDQYFGHNASFRLENNKRLEYLANKSLQFFVPPVVFPWELFDGDSGNFISEDKFIFYKEGKKTDAQSRLLFRHFKLIWENAKRVVLRAEKVSFVGLSMHPYLEDGLKYLFQDFGKSKDTKVQGWVADGTMDGAKPKEVQVVVANLDNEHFRNVESRLHPASPCGRVSDLLRKIAPNLQYVKSSSEYDGMFRGAPTDTIDPDITPRYSFEEFIEREMD